MIIRHCILFFSIWILLLSFKESWHFLQQAFKLLTDHLDSSKTSLLCYVKAEENPMDGGGWWAAVHGVTKSRTRLSGFTFIFRFHALEKEMAAHSNVLAWRIPGMGDPGWLPSMGSHRVGHNWSDLAAAAAAYKIIITLTNWNNQCWDKHLTTGTEIHGMIWK